MNLASWRRRAHGRVYEVVLAALLSSLAGCARLPTAQQLAEFNAAGPARPAVDLNELLKAKPPPGPYRLVPGDAIEIQARAVATEPAGPGEPAPRSKKEDLYRVVIGDVVQLQMPAALRAVGATSDGQVGPYESRVSDDGKLRLPTVGEIDVAGKTLSEVEAAVVAGYFPKYVRRRPTVVARVAEYRAFSVSIVGAVTRPGKYELHSNEMSLIPLLAKAGGIVREGAAAIHVHRAGQPKPLVVPVRGQDIPATDIELKSGDLVQVEPCVFTNGAYTCRVKDDGTIELPIVGAVRASGRTLTEVEAAIASAYFPKYLASPPTVVVSVAEHRTATVSVTGGVEKPGRYELRSHEMFLGSLLMKAGGIVADGAEAIYVRRAGEDNTVVLPVKELNVPLADVPLQDGDTVEVARLDPAEVTVVGLVNKPGTFPYPPHARYTLQQALAISYGVDPVAEPPYARVFRRNGEGKLLSARFELGGAALTDAADVPIKPGDVIAVEHTVGTRWRLFYRRLLRLSVYASYPIAPR